jgi:hypothetical protein
MDRKFRTIVWTREHTGHLTQSTRDRPRFIIWLPETMNIEERSICDPRQGDQPIYRAVEPLESRSMMQHNEERIKIDRPMIERIQTQLSEWLSYSPFLCPTGPGFLCKTD